MALNRINVSCVPTELEEPPSPMMHILDASNREVLRKHSSDALSCKNTYMTKRGTNVVYELPKKGLSIYSSVNLCSPHAVNNSN